jgi:hypothetical protein
MAIRPYFYFQDNAHPIGLFPVFDVVGVAVLAQPVSKLPDAWVVWIYPGITFHGFYLEAPVAS